MSHFVLKAMVCGGILGLSSVSLSLPGMRLLDQKLAKLKAPKSSTAKITECPNFEGKWQGTCTDSYGETRNESLTIEQDECDAFSFGNRYIEIGEHHGETKATSAYVLDFSFDLSWNTGVTGLVTRLNFLVKGLGGDPYRAVGEGYGKMQVIGQSLHTFDELIYNDGRTTETSWYECKYQKAE